MDLLACFWKHRKDGAIVSPKPIVKECDECEVEAMEYVAKNTTIPVPKIIKKHRCKGGVRVEMECIEGDFLNTLWCRNKLSDEQKNSIVDEVSSYIKQLRKLNPPEEGLVGSAFGNAVFDYTVDWSPFGPFKNHDMFHAFRRKNTPINRCCKEITLVHSKKKYRSVFSHGNLVPSNIIVDKNMKVIGIVDWEYSGWFPEYWEYNKAFYAIVSPVDWLELLFKKIGEYKEEYKAEFIMRNVDPTNTCPSHIKRRKYPYY